MKKEITRIDKIFHIADVHLRNFKRHKEYRAVFKKLYKYLKENVDEYSIIYLAGDIVHSKSDMTPELVLICAEFFRSCADIAPTILITGNHDTNLNNGHRLDALTPVVKALNHPDLYYWKDSGVYTLGNISFSVMSLFGSTDKWIKAKDIDAKIKVALHHGAVSSAITDLNHEIENEHVQPKLFDGFDMVMLGDIHKRQTLGRYRVINKEILPSEKNTYLNDDWNIVKEDGELIKISKKYPTIQYAGSTIQQDYGESLEHGILVWNVQKRNSEFVRIENDIAYATIEVDGGKITTPKQYVNALPENLRLRIKYSNCSYIDINKIINVFKNKHNLIEVSPVKISNLEVQSNNRSAILGNVLDVEYQNRLLTEYIKSLPHSDLIEIDGIRHINRLLNTRVINDNVVIRNIIWKPQTFEFSNMFSYGPNQLVDFTNFNGMYGIFGANQAGKSTLLDAITFCIYDKCSRAWKAEDVLHNKKTKFHCKLKFELNNEIYIIERIAVKHKTNDSVKVTVNFGKLTEAGLESLNGHDRNHTNKIIRGYLGSYDDFLLTTLSTQNDNKNFIVKTQRERKDLLNSFLDISIFEELSNLAKNEIKDKQGMLKSMQMENNSINALDLRNKIADITKKYETKTAEFTEIDDNVITLNAKLKALNSKLQHIDEPIDIAEVTRKVSISENMINQLKDVIISYKKSIKENNTELSKAIIDRDKIDKVSAQATLTLTAGNDTDISLNRKLHAETSSVIKIFNKQIEHLSAHEFDPNCEYCVKNKFVQEAYKAKEQLPSYNEKLITIDSEYAKLLEIKNNRSANSELIHSYDKLTNNISNYKTQIKHAEDNLANSLEKIETLKENISNFKEQISNYNKQKKIYLNNEKVNIDILNYEQKIKDANQKSKTLHGTLIQLNGELIQYQTILKAFDDRQNKINEYYAEVYKYEVYIDAFSKKGVPHTLLSQIIPVIQDETNSVLSQLVGFVIKLDTDDRNINCYIQQPDGGEYPVELSSGMERFILSIAVRIGLINVSNLPRPNFIAIDEGFGVADSNTIMLMEILFNYLKTQFDFVLVISHLMTIRDFVDHSLTITKSKQGYSEISV